MLRNLILIHYLSIYSTFRQWAERKRTETEVDACLVMHIQDSAYGSYTRCTFNEPVQSRERYVRAWWVCLIATELRVSLIIACRFAV